MIEFGRSNRLEVIEELSKLYDRKTVELEASKHKIVITETGEENTFLRNMMMYGIYKMAKHYKIPGLEDVFPHYPFIQDFMKDYAFKTRNFWKDMFRYDLETSSPGKTEFATILEYDMPRKPKFIMRSARRMLSYEVCSCNLVVPENIAITMTPDKIKIEKRDGKGELHSALLLNQAMKDMKIRYSEDISEQKNIDSADMQEVFYTLTGYIIPFLERLTAEEYRKKFRDVNYFESTRFYENAEEEINSSEFSAYRKNKFRYPFQYNPEEASAACDSYAFEMFLDSIRDYKEKPGIENYLLCKIFEAANMRVQDMILFNPHYVYYTITHTIPECVKMISLFSGKDDILPTEKSDERFRPWWEFVKTLPAIKKNWTMLRNYYTRKINVWDGSSFVIDKETYRIIFSKGVTEK